MELRPFSRTFTSFPFKNTRDKGAFSFNFTFRTRFLGRKLEGQTLSKLNKDTITFFDQMRTVLEEMGKKGHKFSNCQVKVRRIPAFKELIFNFGLNCLELMDSAVF
jgi:hypothetical protein